MMNPGHSFGRRFSDSAPEFRQKAILLEVDPSDETENVIAEFNCDLEGVTCTNLGKGEKLLRFSIIEQGKSGFIMVILMWTP